jgi:serine/threonine protein kinase
LLKPRAKHQLPPKHTTNTQGYFAPEVLALPLKSSPFEGKSPEEAANRPGYDCKVDVWSAGVVCFEVLTGRAPFAAENVAQVLQVRLGF